MSPQKLSKRNTAPLQTKNTTRSSVKMRLIAYLLLLVCASGAIWFAHQQTTTKSTIATTQTQIDSEPKVIAVISKKETVHELLQRLRKTYPIPEIRNELERLCVDFENGKIKLVLHDAVHGPGGIAWAYRSPDGFPTIGVSLRTFEILREENKDLPHLVEDQFISILLHERFHLVKQDNWRPGGMSLKHLVESERECWWYTVRELFLPMLKNGRLRGYFADGSEGLALKAYQEAKGNIASDVWTRFAMESTGVPKAVFEKHGMKIP